MCGIAGWLDYGRDLRLEKATLDQMTNSLSRRGPDERGLWLDEHIGLGHRRLSVIDLQGGRQPMEAPSGNHPDAMVTFSGEIYNFCDLRAELRSFGVVFRTKSDTEVLLQAYLRWGPSAIERLNGMFAFAIWDLRAQTLALVRDRTGIKPLFYHPTESGVIFGSEPKAILANPIVRRRVNIDGLREVFDMLKTPGTSIYEGISEVKPGHWIQFDRTGWTERRYWKLEAREHTDNYEKTVSTVRDILEDTINRQIVADVPLCSLLSGGLDSSTVTALATKGLATTRLRSFSVDFLKNMDGFARDAVRSSPDAPFAREAAAHVGAEHTEILLRTEELLDQDTRKEVQRAADGPTTFWGDMWPSLYLLFREIRKHSVVALSGEAADEIFGGYPWFHNPNAINADTFPWLTSGSSRYFGGLGLLSPELLSQLDTANYRQARYQEALAEVPTLDSEEEDERRMREITYLNVTRFMQTLLDRKDRMSMAVGLEVRVPFCDHRLLQYVFNVPWAMKCADGREKSLLRAAAKDLLPGSILDRIKTPYPATQDPLYETGLKDDLSDMLADTNAPALPLIDVPKARKVLDRAAKTTSLPYERGSLEVALSLNAWMKDYGIELNI